MGAFAMRYALACLIVFGASMTVHAETYLYVSMPPEQKIQLFRLDPADGKLTTVDSIKVDGAPGSLAVGPHKKFLYASLRTTNSLASFAIDQASGKLKHVSTAALPKDENAAFLATDRTGQWLISASYAAGKVVVHRLQDGTIATPAVQTITTAKTAHCIAIDPTHRWVFVPHVAPNAIYEFLIDPKSGKLDEEGKTTGGTANAGPRHLAFHPSGKMAFTSDETGSSITAYEFDRKGGLRPVQTLSTLPADFKGKNTTAEVKVHPSGKFVWVSNRGHDSLAGFAIDESGKLSAIGQTPTEKTPRSFEIDPDGRFIFAAGEGSGRLAVYRVDESHGQLDRIGTWKVGKSLTWVMAVKLAAK